MIVSSIKVKPPVFIGGSLPSFRDRRCATAAELAAVPLAAMFRCQPPPGDEGPMIGAATKN